MFVKFYNNSIILPRELVKAPLQGPIWYPVHSGDSEEGLNRRGARDLVNSNVIVM